LALAIIDSRRISTMAFFEVKNLSISFGGLEALKDITFNVQQGSLSLPR